MNLRFVTHTSSTNTIWGVPTRFVPLALDTSDSPKKAIICTLVGVHLGSLDLGASRHRHGVRRVRPAPRAGKRLAIKSARYDRCAVNHSFSDAGLEYLRAFSRRNGIGGNTAGQKVCSQHYHNHYTND